MGAEGEIARNSQAKGPEHDETLESRKAPKKQSPVGENLSGLGTEAYIFCAPLFCLPKPGAQAIQIASDECSGRDPHGRRRGNRKKLSGKRTGMGRNSGKPQGAEEAIPPWGRIFQVKDRGVLGEPPRAPFLRVGALKTGAHPPRTWRENHDYIRQIPGG